MESYVIFLVAVPCEWQGKMDRWVRTVLRSICGGVVGACIGEATSYFMNSVGLSHQPCTRLKIHHHHLASPITIAREIRKNERKKERVSEQARERERERERENEWVKEKERAEEEAYINVDRWWYYVPDVGNDTQKKKIMRVRECISDSVIFLFKNTKPHNRFVLLQLRRPPALSSSLSAFPTKAQSYTIDAQKLWKIFAIYQRIIL